MLRKDFKCLNKIEKMPMFRVVGPIVLRETNIYEFLYIVYIFNLNHIGLTCY
jgi:hypothetical protein